MTRDEHLNGHSELINEVKEDQTPDFVMIFKNVEEVDEESYRHKEVN